MTDVDTRSKILDAAEQLFAQQGFAATSLRNIIKMASVNTAAVHYHFGSREGLIAAVMERRAAPMNEERLSALRELESRYGESGVPLEELVEAFVGPPIRLHYDRSSGDWLFPRLMSRAVTEADANVHDLFRKIFGEVLVRFTAAFARSLPGLSPMEIAWRMHFMIGALAFTIAIPSLHSSAHKAGASPFLAETTDVDTVLNRLIGFITAGMRTPPPSTENSEEREQRR